MLYCERVDNWTPTKHVIGTLLIKNLKSMCYIWTETKVMVTPRTNLWTITTYIFLLYKQLDYYRYIPFVISIQLTHQVLSYNLLLLIYFQSVIHSFPYSQPLFSLIAYNCYFFISWCDSVWSTSISTTSVWNIITNLNWWSLVLRSSSSFGAS